MAVWCCTGVLCGLRGVLQRGDLQPRGAEVHGGFVLRVQRCAAQGTGRAVVRIDLTEVGVEVLAYSSPRCFLVENCVTSTITDV